VLAQSQVCSVSLYTGLQSLTAGSQHSCSHQLLTAKACCLVQCCHANHAVITLVLAQSQVCSVSFYTGMQALTTGSQHSCLQQLLTAKACYLVQCCHASHAVSTLVSAQSQVCSVSMYTALQSLTTGSQHSCSQQLLTAKACYLVQCCHAKHAVIFHMSAQSQLCSVSLYTGLKSLTTGSQHSCSQQLLKAKACYLVQCCYANHAVSTLVSAQSQMCSVSFHTGMQALTTGSQHSYSQPLLTAKACYLVQCGHGRARQNGTMTVSTQHQMTGLSK